MSTNRGKDANVEQTPPTRAGNQTNENPEISPSTPENYPGTSARVRFIPTPDLRSTDARCRRKARIPVRFEDFVLGEILHNIEENQKQNMAVKYPYCSMSYANRRNLNRHINSVHNSMVKVYVCPAEGCQRYFYRREYVQLHLRCTHGLKDAKAREKAFQCILESIDRQRLDPVTGNVISTDVATG